MDELEDGQTYVCSSSEVLKKVNYGSISGPQWCQGAKSTTIANLATKSTGSMGAMGGTNQGEATGNVESKDLKDLLTKGKFITLIRNGVKHRKIVKILINQRSSPSWERALDQITNAFHTPPVNRLFTIDGQKV